MKFRIGVLILSFVLFGSLGCTKPSQTGDNSTTQNPDNTQATPLGSEGDSKQARAPETAAVSVES